MGFLDRLKSARDDAKANVPPPAKPVKQEATSLEMVAPATGSAVASSVQPSSGNFPTESPDAQYLEDGFQAPQTSTEDGFGTRVVDDFESEFALAEPSAENVDAPSGIVDFASIQDEELEEWSEPLPSAAPSVLPDGAILEVPEGRFEVNSWQGERGGENIYLATFNDAEGEKGTGKIVHLREATGVAGERLSREAMWRLHWDATARIAMLPRLLAGFKNGETAYLASEMPGEGQTLAQVLASAEARVTTEEASSDDATAAFLSEILLVTTQLAAFLVRLHVAGFAHLGLRPEGILLGKPVQILDCSFAAPLGEPLEIPLSLAGYSAPELSRPGIVDARSDIYAVGAMLYRAVTGSDVPESGADLTTWQPRIVMAGIPQILRRTLGEAETRFNNAEELHRALVKLKNRLRPTVSHAVYGLSTIGLESSRSTNQDAFGFQSGAWETEQGRVAWTAFCVADGMGGMAAGEVASEVAVSAFLRAAAAWSASQLCGGAAPLTAASQANLVKEWATLANEAVVRAMEDRHARGGCTLDAGLVVDRRLCIAHVGDTRLYLLRGDEFEVLSRDHSFVMSLLLQGQITFDEIRTHNERNKITRSLGERHPQPDYFVDTLQVQHGEPSLELQPGDVLLACSDGVWEPVLESEMLDAVREGNLRRAARQILRLALQRGAPDNATLALFRLDEDAAPVFA